MLLVVSIRMTHSDTVIRVMPPSMQVAPMKAYVPGWTMWHKSCSPWECVPLIIGSPSLTQSLWTLGWNAHSSGHATGPLWGSPKNVDTQLSSSGGLLLLHFGPFSSNQQVLHARPSVQQVAGDTVTQSGSAHSVLSVPCTRCRSKRQAPTGESIVAVRVVGVVPHPFAREPAERAAGDNSGHEEAARHLDAVGPHCEREVAEQVDDAPAAGE